MGTKNNPSEFDCYANAEDDEPMFVLLARDDEAPKAIDKWISEKEIKWGTFVSPNTVTLPRDKLAKLTEARQCADAMRQWRAEHPDA